jgi:hypothetical protein
MNIVCFEKLEMENYFGLYAAMRDRLWVKGYFFAGLNY